LLAFTSVYFYESGLFNGLRARKLKKFPAFLNSTPRVAARPRRFGLSSIANTPLAGRLAPASAILILRKIVAVISVFVKPFLSPPTRPHMIALSWLPEQADKTIVCIRGYETP